MLKLGRVAHRQGGNSLERELSGDGGVACNSGCTAWPIEQGLPSQPFQHPTAPTSTEQGWAAGVSQPRVEGLPGSMVVLLLA